MFFKKAQPPAAPRDPLKEFDSAVSKAIDNALADVDQSDFKWNAPRWSRLADLADRLDDRVKSLRMQLAYRPAV